MKPAVYAGAVLSIALTFVPVPSASLSLCPTTRDTQAPDDLKSAIRQADDLLRTWRETGKTDEAKAKLLSHFARCDVVFDKNPEYLLAKSDGLQALGETQMWLDVFQSIPDDALTKPLHLSNRINFSYRKRPEATVVLVRRLAAGNSALAKSAVVDWVHNSLAQAFAPRRKAWVGSTLDPLLDGLCQPDQPELCAITSGIRVWAQAQMVEEAPTRR